MLDLATITGQREFNLLKLPNPRDATVYAEEDILFRPAMCKASDLPKAVSARTGTD
jgi:hypothetical protein